MEWCAYYVSIEVAHESVVAYRVHGFDVCERSHVIAVDDFVCRSTERLSWYVGAGRTLIQVKCYLQRGKAWVS